MSSQTHQIDPADIDYEMLNRLVAKGRQERSIAVLAWLSSLVAHKPAKSTEMAGPAGVAPC